MYEEYDIGFRVISYNKKMEKNFLKGKAELCYKKYGFQKILDDFENTKEINIITFNISAKSTKLLDNLKMLENKIIRIVTNIPNRYENYYGNASERAATTIEKYLKNLEPSSFSSPVEIYFNFHNHSKIYSTDNYTYIGSQNFSDESENNYEIGMIIDNKENEENVGDYFIEEFIFDNNETIRFYGIEIENMKLNFKNQIKKIEEILQSFDIEIESYFTGHEFICEIKEKFYKLSEVLYKIQDIITEMQDDLEKIKKERGLYDIEFIDNLKKSFENLEVTVSDLLYNIGQNGSFYEIYYNPEHDILENTYDADEEHLEKAIERESVIAYNRCDEIEEEYSDIINEFLKSFRGDILSLDNLLKTVEEMTSNIENIDNTKN